MSGCTVRTHRAHLPVSRRRACPRRPGFFVVRSPYRRPGGLLARPHRSLRGLEIEAQPRLWSIAKTHRAEVRGVRVYVVERDVQRARRAPLGRAAGMPQGWAAPRAARHDARRARRLPRCPRGRASSVSSGSPWAGCSYGRPSPAATPFGPRVPAHGRRLGQLRLSAQAPNPRGARNPADGRQNPPFASTKPPISALNTVRNSTASPDREPTAAKTQIPCKLAPRHNLHGQPKPRICLVPRSNTTVFKR